MKKLCLALLVLSMLCGLCACGVGSGGGSTMTTEEMLEVAATLDPSGFYEAVSENKLRAEDDYVGNIYAFTNFVYRIEDDHAEIGPSKQASIRGDALRVYLPEDELKSLSKGEKITVVGELTSLEEMKNAHFVTNVFEVSGEVWMYYLPLEDGSGRPGTGIDRRWCLELKTDEGEYYHFEKEVEVQHTAGIGISTVKISNTSVDAGDHITLSGKIVDSDLLGEYDTERPIQMTDIELVASN